MKHINFYGIKVVGSTTQEVEKDLFDSIDVEERKVVFGINSAFHKFMKLYPWYRDFLNGLDVVLFDGRVLYYLAKILGYKVYCNMSIPEYTLMALEAAKSKKGTVYLLGASEDNNKLAVEKLRNSGIPTEGHHGYIDFGKSLEIKKILFNINNTKPNLLLIGMSSPLKEQLIINHLRDLPNCTVVLCGGMIDIIAGATKQTPCLLKKLGIAWIYRAIQEPRRLLIRMLQNFWFFTTRTFFLMLIRRKSNYL